MVRYSHLIFWSECSLKLFMGFIAIKAHLFMSLPEATWGPRMRLGTQNEIVKIDLHAS